MVQWLFCGLILFIYLALLAWFSFKMNLNWCRACLKIEDRLLSFQENSEIVQAFLDLANILVSAF